MQGHHGAGPGSTIRHELEALPSPLKPLRPFAEASVSSNIIPRLHSPLKSAVSPPLATSPATHAQLGHLLALAATRNAGDLLIKPVLSAFQFPLRTSLVKESTKAGVAPVTPITAQSPPIPSTMLPTHQSVLPLLLPIQPQPQTQQSLKHAAKGTGAFRPPAMSTVLPQRILSIRTAPMTALKTASVKPHITSTTLLAGAEFGVMRAPSPSAARNSLLRTIQIPTQILGGSKLMGNQTLFKVEADCGGCESNQLVADVPKMQKVKPVGAAARRVAQAPDLSDTYRSGKAASLSLARRTISGSVPSMGFGCTTSAATSLIPSLATFCTAESPVLTSSPEYTPPTQQASRVQPGAAWPVAALQESSVTGRSQAPCRRSPVAPLLSLSPARTSAQSAMLSPTRASPSGASLPSPHSTFQVRSVSKLQPPHSSELPYCVPTEAPAASTTHSMYSQHQHTRSNSCGHIMHIPPLQCLPPTCPRQSAVSNSKLQSDIHGNLSQTAEKFPPAAWTQSVANTASTSGVGSSELAALNRAARITPNLCATSAEQALKTSSIQPGPTSPDHPVVAPKTEVRSSRQMLASLVDPEAQTESTLGTDDCAGCDHSEVSQDHHTDNMQDAIPGTASDLYVVSLQASGGIKVSKPVGFGNDCLCCTNIVA